jgi:hypothetical protein
MFSDGKGAGEKPWERTLKYLMPLNARFGPSYTFTIETQSLQRVTTDAWTIQASASTPNVPLGAQFVTIIRYTARRVAPSQTALLITSELRWKGLCLGLMRGIVTAASRRGLLDTYRIVEKMLTEAFPVDVGGEVAEEIVVAVRPREGKALATTVLSTALAPSHIPSHHC